ncbi:hypothetical protein A9Q99_03505 [Gammaproteobacteria bacterium 45_16_T64]|mgnify:CR=1 FL=1|nr:hypothetical protein A9Q99_03505 [Gammaproteobacteria bacterium 45_16_T64]
MTLLAILLALFATRQAVVPDYLKEEWWGVRYLSAFSRWGVWQRFHPAVHYGAFVIPPMLMCWYIGTFQTSWFYDFVDLAISAVLLSSIIGDRQLESAMQPFLKRWRAQEWQAAYVHGEKLLHLSKIVSPSEMLSQTVTLFLLRINQLLFAPIFWFAIFGSGGLVMYIMTYIAANPYIDSGKEKTSLPPWRKIAQEFLQALDGISARLIALSIALMCFSRKALAVAFRRYRVTDREAEIVLKLATKVGLEFDELPDDQELLASEGSSRIHAVQDLKSNVLIFWVIAIAILSLLGLGL